MSEYQYYEFRAVDRPLDRAEQADLRRLSSRARITGTGFVNHYDWGDFRGDPDRLMERHFDLFLYVANWGHRRLSIRLPRRLVDAGAVKPFLNRNDSMTVRRAGENLIVDLTVQDIENEIDGDGWMDALAPLRGDILNGDLRVLYLGWLMGVQYGDVPGDAVEPLAGIGPLTPPLEAFAELFGIDEHLLAAAAESKYASATAEPSPEAVATMIDSFDAREKSAYLLRAYQGDPHLRAELRRRCRSSGEGRQPRRTVADLRATASRLMENLRRAEERRKQAEERKRKEAEDRARETRLKVLIRRGASAWSDVETLIALRNTAYDQAAAMLCDMRELALRQSSDDEFHRRLAELRDRHKSKLRLIERLTTASLV